MSDANAKKMAILVTEDEFSEWGNSLVWQLPRKTVELGTSVGAKDNPFADLNQVAIGDRKEEWLIAEMSPDSAQAKKVPFYKVDSIYGFTEQHAQVLKSRYGELGIAVKTLETETSALFDQWWMNRRVSILAEDVSDGMTAISEMFGTCVPAAMKEAADDIASIVALGEAGAQCEDFQGSLLTYSRSSVHSCEGLMAGLCDLGTLLRKFQKSPSDEDIVNKLGKAVKKSIDEGRKDESAVLAILQSFDGVPNLSLANVIYLHWKYESERMGGSLPFECMTGDIARIRALLKNADGIDTALAMIGGFAGFKNFSVQYHLKMREQRPKKAIVTNVGSMEGR